MIPPYNPPNQEYEQPYEDKLMELAKLMSGSYKYGSGNWDMGGKMPPGQDGWWEPSGIDKGLGIERAMSQESWRPRSYMNSIEPNELDRILSTPEPSIPQWETVRHLPAEEIVKIIYGGNKGSEDWQGDYDTMSSNFPKSLVTSNDMPWATVEEFPQEEENPSYSNLRDILAI